MSWREEAEGNGVIRPVSLRCCGYLHPSIFKSFPCSTRRVRPLADGDVGAPKIGALQYPFIEPSGLTTYSLSLRRNFTALSSTQLRYRIS